MATLGSLLLRRWFLLAIIAALAFGLVTPHAFDWLLDGLSQDWLVAGVMFLMALPLPAERLWHNLRRPRALMLGVLVNMGLAPLAAWPLTLLLPVELAVGLAVTAAVPCTLASAAVWTRQAGGNDVVAVLVMLATNILCVVLTPLWLLALTGRHEQVAVGPMVVRLMLLVALPIVAAQGLRLLRPIGQWSTRRHSALSLAAQLGMLTMVLVAAATAGLRLEQLNVGGEALPLASWAAMLGCVTLLHTAMLGLAHLLSAWIKLPRADRIAVGFSGSQKTMMVAFPLMNLTGGMALAILPMVAYHAVQLLLDTFVVDWLRARGATPGETEPQMSQMIAD